MLPFAYFPWNSHHIPRIITARPRSLLDNGSPRTELHFPSEASPSTAVKLRGKSAQRMYRRMLPMSKAAIGKPAPDFTAKAVFDMDFIDVKLSDYKGKYVVLFFYPADFTFVCPTEIIAFSDRFDEFEALGVQVLACSTDSHFTHLAWISQPRKQGGLGDMKIPVLSDKTMQISRDYGVLKEDEGMSFRGLFIIDTNGILRQITINDMPVGRSVDETLRLVQAFQFVDKHGEVCPAGWKPGEKTIKPEVKQSKEYFEKANANGH